MKELEADNLQEVIQNEKKVIVQYGASWCGACRMIKPQFKSLEGTNEDVAFYYVDAEKYPESRKLATVENLPTFAGFVDGKLVKQQTSSKKQAIEEILSEIASH